MAFDFLWVLEDDVGATGDLIADVFAAYGDERADLLTARCANVTADWKNANGGPWMYADVASDAFLGAIPVEKRVRSAEHVQRFSRALLDELRRCSHLTAWSEMGVPSLCEHFGLRRATLRPEHVGRVYCFDGRLSRDEWQRLREDEGSRGKLWHALKF